MGGRQVAHSEWLMVARSVIGPRVARTRWRTRLSRGSFLRQRRFAGLNRRREDALVICVGFADEAGPFQLCFRHKSHDLTHGAGSSDSSDLSRFGKAIIVPTLAAGQTVRIRRA